MDKIKIATEIYDDYKNGFCEWAEALNVVETIMDECGHEKLQHHKDTTVGLYATDKNPNELFKIIFSDMIQETGMDGNKTFSAEEFEYYNNYFKKGIEKLMFKITGA